MPQFRFTARAASGATEQGEIDAPDRNAAVVALRARGLLPLSIEEKPAAASLELAALIPALRRPPKLPEILLFTRQFYSLVKAGVPLITALTRLAENTPNRVLAEAIVQIARDIESGRDIATSFARHPHLFSTLYLAMLRVGEQTGKLEEALYNLAIYLERDRETIMRIKSALRYPAIVLVAIAIAIGILTTFVIPAFAGIFASAQMQLPLPTRIILAVSSFMREYWWAVLGGIVGGIYAFLRLTKAGPGRLWWDRVKLKLPKIGDIIRRATLARFARALAMAIDAGVPITQALVSVARATDNDFIAEKIYGMLNGIERGETILGAATRTGIFTPIVLQMLAIGEESGRIDEMMQEVAEFYEREVAYDIEHLSDLIEPLMLVIIGVMVLVLALGIFLPMWEMTALARR